MLKIPFINSKVVYQLDSMDCGPACLAMIAKHHGKDYSLQELREKSYITKRGVSLGGVMSAAKEIGFDTFAAKFTLDKLRQAAEWFPCLIHWNDKHFVILEKIEKEASGKEKYYVIDPSHGKVKLDQKVFTESWMNASGEGVATLFTPQDEFYTKEVSKNNTPKLSYLFQYLTPFKSQIMKLLAIISVGSLITLVFPFLTQILIDKGIEAKSFGIIKLILMAQLSLFLGSMVVKIYRNWLTLYIGTNTSIILIADFLKKLVQLPIKYFDAHMIGDLDQRVHDNDRIERLLTTESVNTFFSIVTLLVFSGVLYYYDFLILLVYMSLTIIAVLWTVIWLKKRRILDYHLFKARSEHQLSVYEIFEGIREMKINQFENFKRGQWEIIQRRLFDLNMKALKIDQIQLSGFQFVNHLKNILVTYLAAVAVVNGHMSLGVLLSISYIIGEMNSPINQFVHFMKTLQDAKLSFERLGEIHTEKPEEDPDFLSIDKSNQQGVKINNLNFQYGDPDSPRVLKDVSLNIPAGKVTAIVGHSGSGKTTLLKILLRFYNIDRDVIEFEGEDINDISPMSIREHSGVVMQDGFIFSDSIALNVCTGTGEVDETRLQWALDNACINEFIETLPQKEQTVIGMAGNGLSGGQTQRLLIARAIYKNPKYLFLDEATSSLDSKNEKRIQNNLQRIFEGKTVIIIAHRLSTVKNADQIVVLDKGEVVEIGNHSELIEKKDHYYNLIKNQLELST